LQSFNVQNWMKIHDNSKKIVWIKVYEIIVYIFGLEVVFIFKIMSFKSVILQYLFIFIW
jgi:hypothetical protein